MLLLWQLELFFKTLYFIFSLPSKTILTSRDLFVLQQVNKYTLTPRLVWECALGTECRFVSKRTLYARLQKLRDEGFLKCHPMLWSHEKSFYLSRKSQLLLEQEGIEVPSRSIHPVGDILQRHEYALSQFLIKWQRDCGALNIPIVAFYRDGSFFVKATKRNTKKWVPDGVIVIRTKGKNRAFLLEMDRGTQTGGLRSRGVFRQKLEQYKEFKNDFRVHPELNSHQVTDIKLITVCQSQQRLSNLCQIAGELKLHTHSGFTCWSRFMDFYESSSRWEYKKTNVIAAPLFSYPSRDPPLSVLHF